MTPDRYGEPDDSPRCRDPRCRRGWLGHDDEGRPIPCLNRKPHLRKTADTADFSERIPSARAQQAVNQDQENNQ